MEEKLGQGRRNSDRRKSGIARRVRHTTGHDNDMVGDRRKLSKGSKPPQSAGGRSVPIAETIGGDLKRRDNGAGRRVAPTGLFKVGGGPE